jgi:DNA helicase TIP49 (TBP-interacting protein)
VVHGSIMIESLVANQCLKNYMEFKNILNVGRIWLKFKEENRPFGISPRDKMTHSKISSGDIIQIDKDYYMVNSVGARKVKLVD